MEKRDHTLYQLALFQSVALGEYERTGIPVDGLVTRQLLVNIFEKNTPLHDRRPATPAA